MKKFVVLSGDSGNALKGCCDAFKLTIFLARFQQNVCAGEWQNPLSKNSNSEIKCKDGSTVKRVINQKLSNIQASLA